MANDKIHKLLKTIYSTCGTKTLLKQDHNNMFVAKGSLQSLSSNNGSLGDFSTFSKTTPLCSSQLKINKPHSVPFIQQYNRISTNIKAGKERNFLPFSDFLTDTIGRQHNYLRISLTEKCNLR